jgi:hypothetical protein
LIGLTPVSVIALTPLSTDQAFAALEVVAF